jgi:predicted DNA-binding protein
MARTNGDPNTDVITLRIPPALKAALAEIATQEEKPVGELLRELIRQRVEEKEQREFEIEARRQCLEANAAAQDANSDEAAVMRELEVDMEDFSKEWK